MFVLKKCVFERVKELLGAVWAVGGELRKLGSINVRVLGGEK